jgi:hypothetical protein
MSPRHFVTVPDSDTEIMEEVGHHRMTKQGMKSTYKQAPIEQPPLEKGAQASRSRNMKKKQTQLPEVGAAQSQPAQMDDMHTHVFIEGQEDDLPDFGGEEVPAQTRVSSYLFLWWWHVSRNVDCYGPMAPISGQLPQYSIGDGGSDLCHKVLYLLFQRCKYQVLRLLQSNHLLQAMCP